MNIFDIWYTLGSSSSKVISKENLGDHIRAAFPDPSKMTEASLLGQKPFSRFKKSSKQLQKLLHIQAIRELVFANGTSPAERTHTTLIPNSSESMFWLGLDRFDYRPEAKSGCLGLPKKSLC